MGYQDAAEADAQGNEDQGRRGDVFDDQRHHRRYRYNSKTIETYGLHDALQ